MYIIEKLMSSIIWIKPLMKLQMVFYIGDMSYSPIELLM